MSALDDAIAHHMAHGAGAMADPLTDSLAEQMATEPAPLRAGWENEPIEVPMPWLRCLLVMVLTVVISLLAACGGNGDDELSHAELPCAEAFVGPLQPGQQLPACGRKTPLPPACQSNPEACS